MVVGQAVISRSVPPSTKPTQFGLWLNGVLHSGIPSIDNVINGIPIFIIGCFLLALALRGIRLLPIENGFESRRPFAFNMVAFAVPGIFFAVALFGTTLWSLVHLEYKNWMIVGWLASVLIILGAIAIWDNRRGINLSPGLPRKDILWILGLMIFALVLGVYRLQAMPDSLMGDEGYFWTAARDIAEGLFKPPIFTVGVYTFPVLSTYIQAWILKVFGISLWGWRLSSVLSGIVTIVPLYLLARDGFNRKVAIASSVGLIISPYFLAFTRLGYISIQSLFLTTLAVYWLYTGLNRDSHLYLFLAGCASGLGFYTFFSARISILIALSFIGFMWLGKKINLRKAAFAIILVGIGALLISGPYFLYGSSHDASGMSYKIFESLFFNIFYGKQYFSENELYAIAQPFTINGNTLFFNPKIYLILIASGVLRTWLAFQKPGLITEHFISTSLTGTVGVIFFLVGLGIIIAKFKQPRSMLLLLWFFGVFFGLSALNTVPPRHTHMVSIIPALAIFTGLGLYAIAGALKALFKRLAIYRNAILRAGITLLILGGVIDFFVLAPHKYHPQPDQVMSWAALYARDESFVYVYSNPNQQNFQPYVITEFRKNIPFRTISVETLDADQTVVNWAQKTIVFYTPDLAGKVEPFLNRKWGEGLIEKTFYSTDGIPVLTAGMNTPFVFVRDQTPLMILRDSYFHPPLLILIAVLACLVVLFIFLPKFWISPVRKIFSRLTEWIIGPAYQVPGSEEQTIFEDPEFVRSGEALPSEPPDWAENIFPADQPARPKRLRIDFKLVDKASGKDMYFRIHIPSIRIPGVHIPDAVKISLPSFKIPNPFLLSLAILSAILAQIMISSGNSLAGILFYLLSLIGLIIWIRINPGWSHVFANQLQISPLAEKVILSILIATSAIFRFFDLSSRVYGLDLQEIKLTLQSWYSTILMIDKGDLLSTYQLFPIGFWIRSVFLRIFGVNFLSARIESATLNIVAIILVYFLVRKLFKSKPVALLTTTMYSFSFVVLRTAHQALGEPSTEMWILCTLYFLILGLRERKWWQFQVTGIFLSIGLLTSRLFLPTPVLVILYILGIAIFETLRKRMSVRIWLQFLFATLWPTILVVIIYAQQPTNIRMNLGYATLTEFFNNGMDVSEIFHFLSTNANQLFTTLFSHAVVTDSILPLNGHFINPIFLPFVMIGLFNNLKNFSRDYNGIIPLWFLSFIGLGPVAMNLVSPNVLVLVLVPLMIWGALGLWISLGVIRAWFIKSKVNLAVPIFIIIILAIISSDYHNFISRSPVQSESQRFHELSDFSSNSANTVPKIIYAYEDISNDSLTIETEIITLSLAGKSQIGFDSENHFNQIPVDTILNSLWDYRNISSLDLFLEKVSNTSDQRPLLSLILKCYPRAFLKESGQFYEVYHFDNSSLVQPFCHEDVPPSLVNPPDDSILPSGTPINLTWDNHGVRSTSYLVSLDKKVEGNYWLEAENTFSGSHWITASEFADGFSDNGFLLDEWDAGTAEYTLPVSKTGEYQFWIRTYKRRINDQQNYISINGTLVPFSGDQNPLNEWVWENLGTYSISKGPLSLILSRTYGKDEEYSVFIDALLITSHAITQPDRINIWESARNTIEGLSTSQEYSILEGLPEGEYRWRVRIFNGDSLIDSKGARGLEMPFATFTVRP